MVLAGAENLVGKRIRIRWNGETKEVTVAVVATSGSNNKLCVGFFFDEDGKGVSRLLLYAYDDVLFIDDDQGSDSTT